MYIFLTKQNKYMYILKIELIVPAISLIISSYNNLKYILIYLHILQNNKTNEDDTLIQL